MWKTGAAFKDLHSGAPLDSPSFAETVFNRLAGLEASKQPSYGKRTQLIPDGINDPSVHLARALELSHPFNSAAALKSDHNDVIANLDANPLVDLKKRWGALETWRRMLKRREIGDLKAKHDGSACDNARRLDVKPNCLPLPNCW